MPESSAARERRNVLQRERRRANPAHYAALNKKHRDKHRERYLESARKWREDHREELRAREREQYRKNHAEILAKKLRYRQENRDLRNAKAREYYKSRRDKFLESSLKWQAKHKDRLLTYNREYRRLKKATDPVYKARVKAASKIYNVERRMRIADVSGSHTAADIRRLYNEQEKKCAVCRISIEDGYHVDHNMPISLGGSNDPGNLQLLCAPCNLKKGARSPQEWKAYLLEWADRLDVEASVEPFAHASLLIWDTAFVG